MTTEKGKAYKPETTGENALNKNVNSNLGLASTFIYIYARERKFNAHTNPTNDTPTKKLSALHAF
jgi:hypothetical protein